MDTLKFNTLNKIMSKEDCLKLINLELAQVLRETIEKLDTHFFVDALELFSQATQLHNCIKVCVEEMNLTKYKSTMMYIGVRDKFCDLLAGRRGGKGKDDIDEAIEEGRKEISIRMKGS